MRLRRAVTAADHDGIADLQIQTLPSDKPLDSCVGDWWLIYHDGEPVAFAGMKLSRLWVDCQYLCRSGVVPAHRGKGLQRRLIKVREHYARQAGMNWLITDTTQNPASSNSLMACGFRLYEPAAPWGNRYTLYWRKRI
jgi:GNAT superfamily N-acetyltransferase